MTSAVARDGQAPAVAARSTSLPRPTRRRREALTFAAYAAPFVATALGYALVGHGVGLRPVHVRELYELDARLFSLSTASGVRPLSEVVAASHRITLDLLCGGAYFLYLFEVLGVAAWLFFRARPLMLELSLGFLLVNLCGWVVWLLYPTAPPWYVDAHGFATPSVSVASNAAALTRVDAWLGVDYFQGFYAKSAYVFGAFPSLHVAYATLVALVTRGLRGPLRVATALYALGIAFAAIYLRHHYVVDVLGGASLALAVWLSFRATALGTRNQQERAP